MSVVFLDFETSGFNPYHDDIIEIALKLMNSDTSYNTLVHPQSNECISQRITAVTSITNELLRKEGIPWETAFTELNDFLKEIVKNSPNNKIYIVAHNGEINAIRGNRKVSVFSNMSFAPVYVDLVCELIFSLLTTKLYGIYQYSASCDITYLEAAQVLFESCNAGHLVEKMTWQESGKVSFHVPSSTSLCSNVQIINPEFKAHHPLTLLSTLWKRMN